MASPWSHVPHAAPDRELHEVQRITARVRSKGRWHGWVWLVLGVSSPLFLLGAVARPVRLPVGSLWIALVFMAVTGGLVVWHQRRPVVSAAHRRADRPLTWAYVACMVATVAVLRWIGDDASWTVVPLALVPSVPCAIGAAWLLKQ